MGRVDFINHRGVRILHVDYSGLSDVRDVETVAAEATEVVTREEPHSILALIDVRDTRYSLRLTRSLGDVAVANSIWVRARAMLGLPREAGPAIRELAGFSGKPTELFEDYEAAIDWLAERDSAR